MWQEEENKIENASGEGGFDKMSVNELSAAFINRSNLFSIK